MDGSECDNGESGCGGRVGVVKVEGTGMSAL